jgi:hypothetical protein
VTYDSAADTSVRRVRFYCVFDLWLFLNKVEAILHLHTVESSLLSGPLSHVLMANTHPVRTWDTMQHPASWCTLISATSFTATAYLGKVEYLFGSRTKRHPRLAFISIYSWHMVGVRV